MNSLVQQIDADGGIAGDNFEIVSAHPEWQLLCQLLDDVNVHAAKERTYDNKQP